MCQRAVCQSCRKVTYEGCGGHVEQVLAGVPTPQRCMCEPRKRKPVRKLMTPPGPNRPKDGRWARLIAWMKSAA
jgi:hypothetical protein